MKPIGVRLRRNGWRVLVAATLALLVMPEALTDATAAKAGQADALRAATALRPALKAMSAVATPSPAGRQNVLSDQSRALVTFYARRGFEPIWTKGGQPTLQAASVLRLLCDAGDYGLMPEDYACTALTRMLHSLQQRSDWIAAMPRSHRLVSSSAFSGPGTVRKLLPDWTGFELQLSAALMAFIGDVHYGRINPHAAGFELPARQHLDRITVLAQLATATDPRDVVATVEPRYVHYRLLREALPRYRALAQRPNLSLLPPLPRPKLALGDRYQGAPALRTLLHAIGCLDRTDAIDPFRIDAPLIEALKQFQWQHGLLVDGVLGQRTYHALTVPFAQRVRQIELTLERWRWLPPLSYPTVLVNIPQFRLFAFSSPDDREQGMLRMDVIVGGEYGRRQTPVFTADMTAVVFRPYWDVPRSIVLREVLPELARNPSYLETQHLELVRGETDTSPVVAATPQNLRALADGTLRLRQRPGPDNALGLVKFLLPNSHDVYLHDTPAIQLFHRAQRTFSHGCIRVSDPVALAHYALADNEGNWTEAKILAAMHAGSTERVPLARPVHVMILYGTAVASEDGKVHFFDDIYRQDRRLEALLALPPVARGSALPWRAQDATLGLSLPKAHPAGVDMHEIRDPIKAHAPAADGTRQSR